MSDNRHDGPDPADACEGCGTTSEELCYDHKALCSECHDEAEHVYEPDRAPQYFELAKQLARERWKL